MVLKKFLAIFLFLTIILCSISFVSAEETLENITLEDSNGIDEIISVEGDSADEMLEQPLEEDAVSDGEPGTFKELQNLFYFNDVIEFDRDYIYNPEVDNPDYFYSGMNIGSDIVIYGNGHTIYGNGARILHVYDENSLVKFYNVTFENIFSPEFLSNYDGEVFRYGGAINNIGNLYLYNCTFINNYAAETGGAICSRSYSYITNLFLYDCTFINCSSGEKGGAVYSGGIIQADNCTFYNSISGYGASIYAGTESNISNSRFEDNVANFDGGAIFNPDSSICEIYNSTFRHNIATNGGAMVNCIARECIFASDNYAWNKGHDMYNCVNMDCTFEDGYSNRCFNTSNSTGFSFKPVSLIIDQHNETFDVLVTSNPNGEAVKAIAVNVTLKDNEHNVYNYVVNSNAKGIASFSLSNLENGEYNITVSFVNKNYNDAVSDYTLKLGKSESKITFSASIVFEYGRAGSIYVTVDGGTLELKNIRVIGHPEAKIYLKGDIVTISGLNVGAYTLSVESTPDESHFSSIATIGITVKKAVAVIKASKLTVALKKGTLWTINLVDAKTGAPIANMKLILKVYTGKKYKTVTVTTNSKGEAKYKTSALTKGTHKVVVSGNHPGYSFNTLTSSIKVIKQTALKFKLQKRVNDKNGALISYVVMNKKTKKGVNGVKINLLIYTGKKVKKVTLKTKKSGKYNGAMGFATNELSVGKHKVVIAPANIKYGGSAKTSMIIKKAAKKRQLYSHKL